MELTCRRRRGVCRVSDAPAPESTASADRQDARRCAAQFADKRPRLVAGPWPRWFEPACRLTCAGTVWKEVLAKGSSCAQRSVHENSARRLRRLDNWYEWHFQTYRRYSYSCLDLIRHFCTRQPAHCRGSNIPQPGNGAILAGTQSQPTSKLP